MPQSLSGRLRIIVGIDFGTTFTGISYVTSDKTSANDIDVLRTWPGNGCPVEGNWKTPSVIAYKQENPSATRNRWGYEVRGNMTSCSWTKLLLDQSAETAEFDDPSLQLAAGGAFFHLPKGKTAEQVCQDYLSNVYNYLVENLKQRMTPEVFNITPMECYLTVPAIWTDKAQSATRRAAINASFASRHLDTLRMITEPEAAAIAALKHDLKPGSVNEVVVGDNILVLDCGGGTVDITTYTIQKTEPIIEFEEICVGAGANFHKFMLTRFGTSFEKAPPKFKGAGSHFMQAFEKAKQSFGSLENDTYEIGPIPLGSNHKAKHYDIDEECVILSKADMTDIFAPVVDDVLRLVAQQINKALEVQKKRINLIILVGGFGNSDHLKKAVDTWAGKNGIKCIRPNFCQAAVVRGAAIRGLEGTVPSKLICRRHYGFRLSLIFKNGVHDEKNAYWDFGVKRSRSHVRWMINKGTEVTKSTSFQCPLVRTLTQGASKVFTMDLYSCTLDSAPERAENPRIIRVGSINMDFSSVDLSGFKTRTVESGGFHQVETQVEFEIRLDYRSESGVLGFTCISKGQNIGHTTIEFQE
ncbi:hypothetical protein B0T16DRAFT_432585 [Cercophora newfieldiana]|uniref:Actin-like ATPase domain-containing protein n=1 Tax=Cercophora newfieldiana TaxID=92897 RepID=A0AA39YNN9_9PEZI|nr:hypothetical protein B0T16DRAFT_432585 [Cercophora newfieldiana]